MAIFCLYQQRLILQNLVQSSNSIVPPTFLSSPTYFPAENLTEYKWPPDDTGEYYMLQEQVSEYLGVTSFKRKYPGKKWDFFVFTCFLL